MEPATVNKVIGVILLFLIFSMFFSFSFDLKLHLPHVGCPSETKRSDDRLIAQSQRNL
jgi:hypothetical protein